VNATAIATGGYSTARQFDCGSGTYGDTSLISFHFTFTNTPQVVCSIVGAVGNGYLFVTTPNSITTSGFTLSYHYFPSGNSTIASGGSAAISWIAIG